MAAGSVTLGGNLSIAVGPLGRNGEALGSVNSSGKLAAMCVASLVAFPSSYSTFITGTATRKQEVSSAESRSRARSSSNAKMQMGRLITPMSPQKCF